MYVPELRLPPLSDVMPQKRQASCIIMIKTILIAFIFSISPGFREKRCEQFISKIFRSLDERTGEKIVYLPVMLSFIFTQGEKEHSDVQEFTGRRFLTVT